MGGYLPQVFERFGAEYPAVMEAFRDLAECGRAAGQPNAVTRKPFAVSPRGAACIPRTSPRCWISEGLPAGRCSHGSRVPSTASRTAVSPARELAWTPPRRPTTPQAADVTRSLAAPGCLATSPPRTIASRTVLSPPATADRARRLRAHSTR